MDLKLIRAILPYFQMPDIGQLVENKTLHEGCAQSDFQSGVDKQKNQLTLDLMGQNLALC